MQVKFECVWKSRECCLSINLDRGFVLSENPGSTSGTVRKELWEHSFSELSASNDDGVKLLWLQFRGKPHEDEFEFVKVNPKVVVFTIHNFLSCLLTAGRPV